MGFFRPTKWKLIFSLLIFLCFYLFINIFWAFYGTIHCSVQFPALYNNTNSWQSAELFAPRPTPHSFTSIRLDDTIAAMLAILSKKTNPCATRQSPSFTLAANILMVSSYLLFLIVSYFFTCNIVFAVNIIKRHRKKISK